MKTNIENFRNLHDGARITILGSSPTIKLYEGEEDVAIAVNGASICDVVKEFGADYFVCGDKNSPSRKWFEESRKTCKSRLVASFIAPYDYEVILNSLERDIFRDILVENGNHQNHYGGDIRFTPDFQEIASPHGVFIYADLWEQEISSDQRRFCRGGTISGVAAQIALVMGAKEIHLYGCSFGRPNGSNVHYAYNNGIETGGIQHFHPIRMDYILSRLVEEGVRIVSHGFTKLRVPEKINGLTSPQ